MLKNLGRKKLVQDISASTIQAVVTQLFGLLIFYFTSRYLEKDDFGELNWLLAIGSTVIAVASLGLDLVAVRKISAGEPALQIAGMHFFHTLIAGSFILGVVGTLHVAGYTFLVSHPLIFLVFLHLALANVANSFKLALNGLEAYRRLAVLALVANSVRLAGIIGLWVTATFTLRNVALVYVLTSAVELAAAYYVLRRAMLQYLRPLLLVRQYKYFILESLPQLGVVIFDSALARIDWILLGVLTTQTVTADYSFAYRVFELSKLPLLIIAPVLLTRFSKIFRAGGQTVTAAHKQKSLFLLRLEMFLILVIPVVLFVGWTPVMELLTDGKYGGTNQLHFRILAFCVPLAAMINYLWTLGFVQGQLKSIMLITIISSVCNIGGNMVLIPLMGGAGAAWSFLGSTVIQLLLYFFLIRQTAVRLDLRACVWPLFAATVAVGAGLLTNNNFIFAVAVTLAVFFGLGFLHRQLRPLYVLSRVGDAGDQDKNSD